MEWATVIEQGKLVTRPVWVIVLDHEGDTIYESLVSHENVHEMCTQRHGLRKELLHRQRRLKVVRSQLINFFVAAKTIVGHGLTNHLRWLGLTQGELSILERKTRDMNWHFSPKRNHSCSFAVNAFLAFDFRRVVEMHRTHPYSNALAALYMYLMWPHDIENAAREYLETGSPVFHKTNEFAEGKLRKFLELIREGKADWPNDWRRTPYEKEYKFPTLDNLEILPFDPEDEEEENDVVYPQRPSTVIETADPTLDESSW
ncbi:uncharacterized protein LOC141857921 [Brevipalpus obovatus]|uniref:uncharacterized protein LOC141857921 n=1 Tax=Brevipalpus obovatus TaxID=246614 RepID=UPI003D9DEEBC